MFIVLLFLNYQFLGDEPNRRPLLAVALETAFLPERGDAVRVRRRHIQAERLLVHRYD